MAAKLARSSYGLSIADCFLSKYNYLINFEYDYLRKIIFKTLKIPLIKKCFSHQIRNRSIFAEYNFITSFRI